LYLLKRILSPLYG